MNARVQQPKLPSMSRLPIEPGPSAARPVESAGSLRRWMVSLFVVLAVHAGLAVSVMSWQVPLDLTAPEAGAVMVEFAPLPQAPAAEPKQVPVEPKQIQAEPPPPAPIEEEIPDVEPPPEVKPEVVVQKKPDPKPEPLPETAKQEPQPETAPPPAQTQPAEVASAPSPVESAKPPSNAVPIWQGLVLAQLEREKRYPRSARARRHEGVVHLRFSMDREGNVLDYEVTQSSGHTTLDREVIAMIQRVERLPPPPAELEQNPVDLIVPIQFSLK